MSQSNRSKHKQMLSSLTTLGASQRPAPIHSVARPRVVASVAAAGMSLVACQSAEAGTIIVSNPNVSVGFAAGAVSNATLNLASVALHIGRFPDGDTLSVFFSMPKSRNRVGIAGKQIGATFFPSAVVYGKKLSQAGTRTGHPNFDIATSSGNGIRGGKAFSDEYFDFSFTDSNSQKHYGWLYGSVTGGSSFVTYNLISYGYDTTPNVEIGAGYTDAAPEPSTGVMFAFAALILGAVGVRQRNKAQV